MSDALPNSIPHGHTKTGRSLRQQYFWPLGFWRIKFTGKRRWMLGLPLLIGLGAGATLNCLPRANLAHDRGLLEISSGLLSMLVGFFVAALGVVIALPPGQRLDTKVDEDANPPKIGNEILTWRQFANRMTAYLVFISLLTYVIATVALVVHPGIDWSLYSELFRHCTRVVTGGLYAGLFAHVLSVTLFSLFWIAGAMTDSQTASSGVIKPTKRPVGTPDQSDRTT